MHASIAVYRSTTRSEKSYPATNAHGREQNDVRVGKYADPAPMLERYLRQSAQDDSTPHARLPYVSQAESRGMVKQDWAGMQNGAKIILDVEKQFNGKGA
ncbi:hypothetical protein CHU98_g8624 [Xylaria longipes]|nr:hypothetical protein CHU98_g8624 [Xylaria longipes]